MRLPSTGGLVSGLVTSLLPAREVGRVACECELGESPVWMTTGIDSRALLWVDVPRGTLHLGFGEKHRAQQVVSGALAAVAELTAGRILAAGDRHVYVLASADAGDAAGVAEIPEVPAGVTFNDAKPGPDGRVWLATVSRATAGGGALWTYAIGEGLVLRRSGISHGNGLGWNADGTRMHFVDSGARTLTSTRFDSASATIGTVEFELTLPSEVGIPDGLAVDAEDCIWLAVWGGYCLLRISPSGSILGRVPIPTRNVTSCAFMGPGLQTLAVTTAADDVDPSAPGGDLYLVDVGVAGAPVGVGESNVGTLALGDLSNSAHATAKE